MSVFRRLETVACGHELFLSLRANVMLMMMLINANNFAAHQSMKKKERKYHVIKTCASIF